MPSDEVMDQAKGFLAMQAMTVFAIRQAIWSKYNAHAIYFEFQVGRTLQSSSAALFVHPPSFLGPSFLLARSISADPSVYSRYPPRSSSLCIGPPCCRSDQCGAFENLYMRNRSLRYYTDLAALRITANGGGMGAITDRETFGHQYSEYTLSTVHAHWMRQRAATCSACVERVAFGWHQPM